MYGLQTVIGGLLALVAIVGDPPPPVDATQPNAAHPPITAAPPPSATELNRSILRFVEDNAPPRGERDNPDEASAYDYIISFARRVPLDSFQKAARREFTFAQMLGSEAAKYRGEVVHVEGKLKRIRDIGPTPGLEADGVKHLYEAWILSNLYEQATYCVLLTELPEGVTVAESMDRAVTFDGYFYKVYPFRAGNTVKRSPLLVGRTVTPTPAPKPGPAPEQLGSSVAIVLGVAGGGLLVAGLLLFGFWWADRRTKARLANARSGSVPPPTMFHEPNPYDGSPSIN